MLLAGLVTVPYWFVKKRTIAMGLVVTGNGAGTLIFSLITQPLLDALQWRNTLRVQVKITNKIIYNINRNRKRFHLEEKTNQ